MKMKRDKNFRPDSIAIYEDAAVVTAKEPPKEAAVVGNPNPNSAGADAPLPGPPSGRPAAAKLAALSNDVRMKPSRIPSKEAKADPNAIWQIGECDLFKYEMLDDCLTFEDEIPVAVRDKVHNRYMDILPNPKTRVPLPAIAGNPVRLQGHSSQQL